ncbi:MAG TPA: hypothetical protein VMI32_12820 [Candidatus Solibacter sp.]|nr:hypothetical protein [Candidatus Solibacter sp.]
MQDDKEITGRVPMTCEEFVLACPEVRSAPADGALRQAVLEHARQCPPCAALQASLQTLQDDLRYLGLETRQAEAPARVQMRVMQEFRNRHRTEKRRRFVWIGAWGLAAAATVVATVSWTTWRHEKGLSAWPGGLAQAVAMSPANAPTVKSAANGLVIEDTLVASSASGDFTLLPGSTPLPMEDATVIRVQMQRGALGALGFTVNEERASDVIQVDLLVGDDGLPQAVRLPGTSQ